MQQQQVRYSQRLAEVAYRKKFSELSQVRAAVTDYIEGLRATSQYQAGRGKCAEDKDHTLEVLSFQPPAADSPPIILIGGMGPLAGAVGFNLACEYFGTRREIVLYQACSIPSRMTAMVEPNRRIDGLPIQRYLVEGVSEAIAQAKKTLQSKSAKIMVMLMCNAVHYYLPLVKADLQKRYPKLASELEYISLVEAAIAEMEKSKLHKPLLLGTSATRMGEVYSAPLDKRGIKCKELSEGEQKILMSAIYQGVKAFDREYTCSKGEKLLNLLDNKLNSKNLDIDCAIAGCTEVPILLDWLQDKNKIDDAVRGWLAQVKVINPVISAFRWIGDREEALLSVK